MSRSLYGDALRLPAGSRLLYIGPMKTGTTAIQIAASQQRQTLLDHGVRYPGNGTSHKSAFGALMGWATRARLRQGTLAPDRLDIDRGGVPDPSHWDKLKAEIDSDSTRRIFVTHEYVSQANDATCNRIVEELGADRIHVAITLRPPAAFLASWWAQNVKADAQTEPFDRWLRRIYDPDSARPMPDRFHRFYHQGELVNRWARLVGPERVTVIVGDKSQPNLLTDAFEALLDLPSGLLARGQDTNRALTAPEATLFRRLNEVLHDRKVGWSAYRDLVRSGAVRRGLLQGPTRSGIGTRLRLPEWAGAAASRDGERFAERIRDTGVRVVGDLDILGSKSEPAPYVEHDEAPLEVSVQALVGTVLAGQRVQRRLDTTAGRLDTSVQRVEDIRTRNRRLKDELARVRQELADERTHTLAERVRNLSVADRPAHTATAFTTSELIGAAIRRIRSKLRPGKLQPGEGQSSVQESG